MYNSFSYKLIEMEFFETDDTFFKSLKDVVNRETFECTHEHMIEDGGMRVCMHCGIEDKILDYSPEWRHFDATNPNPSRCSCARPQVSTIDKQLDCLKTITLTTEIKRAVENKYHRVTSGKTMRGTARRGIIAACVMFALREIGNIHTADQIREMFDLDKKSLSAGMSRYFESFPEDRIKHIHPQDLIYGVCTKIQIPHSHLPEIMKLMKMLEKCSRTMMHSNPQSVTAAIVYLYLCMNLELKESLGITRTKFATKVNLSDITVSKLAKEAKDHVEKINPEKKITISDVKPKKR